MFDVLEAKEASEKLRTHRIICGKKIIIVEGPAGSGKTTLLKKLADLPHTDVVRRSLGKRSFGRYEAGAKSFLNDTIKMSNAVLAKDSVVFIDRCAASQLVYDAIRRDREIEGSEGLNERTNTLALTLAQEMAWRTNGLTFTPEIYWLFLIPKAPVLRDRRSQTGKEYPHSPNLEIHHYKRLSSMIVDNGLPRVNLLRPRYDNDEDLVFILKAFDFWLEHFPYLDFPTLWRCFATLPKETK